MATVYHAFGSWVAATDADSLPPGDAHSWVQWGWGLDYGTANTITAHPLMGGDEQTLAVENVRQDADSKASRGWTSCAAWLRTPAWRAPTG